MSGDARRVAAVGKATLDEFVVAPALFAPHRIAASDVLELPVGDKLDVEDILVASGGNATNAAVTLARQGLDVDYIWTLGTDVVAGAIAEELRLEGVGLDAVGRNSTVRASRSVILIAATGERTILNHPGSTPAEHGAGLDLGPLRRADWAYISSTADVELLSRIVGVAAAAQTRVLLNPSGIELREPSALDSLLPRCAVLAVNTSEARTLLACDERDPARLAVALQRRCPIVVVTDGATGAAACDGTEIVVAGIYERPEVVDTTGCGDAFASGLLSRLVVGESLAEAVRFGSANACSVLTRAGAKAGILRRPTDLHDMPMSVRRMTEG